MVEDNVDLFDIIFNKLDEEKRNKLLDHFKNSIVDKKLHLLMDIDDTVYPGGLRGTNMSYKEKEIYPMLVMLYNLFLEKDRFTSGFSTLLTARPHFMKKK